MPAQSLLKQRARTGSSLRQKAYRGESAISQCGWGIANDSGLRGDEQDPHPVAGKGDVVEQVALSIKRLGSLRNSLTH
jgi:hypothetical protein